MLLLFIFTLGVAMSRQRLKGIDTTACSYLTVLSLSLVSGLILSFKNST